MRIPLELPPGLNGDDTTFSAQGRWADASNVRFRNGRAQTIGGWESLTTTLLTGVCRTVFAWSDNAALLNVGFGTHSNLQLYQGGVVYDITPTLALPSIALPANPLTTTGAGSPNVTFTWNGHPLTTSDTLNVAGATAVGGITPNGGPFSVVAVTTNTVTFAFTSNATSGATGGGSAVVISPQRAFAAGQIDGTGGSGFGTGGYGVGGYGLPSTTDYFPRTWATAAWGQQFLANPRNGTIHAWTNNTASVAAPLLNAPPRVSAMLVAPNGGAYQVFALGCNQEADGVFNPMNIRHSSIRNNTEWNTSNTTTAREYTLEGGGRIVAGRMCGEYILVWTNDSLFIGEYVGDLNAPWLFKRVARRCGLIGPNAAVVVGQVAYWVSPDRQFYSYPLGGQPSPIPCQVRDEFASNLADAQGDKIVASSCAQFSEIRFDYPDARDGVENSRYVGLCVNGPDAGAWSKGQMVRTAFVDAGPSDFPIGVTYAGNVYLHERGNTADGGAFAWFIETADQYLNEGEVYDVLTLWPDLLHQAGPVYLTLESRFYPQDTASVEGPYTLNVGDQKADFRACGRLFRVKFSGNSGPTQVRLGKLDFEVENGSEDR